MTDEQKAKFLNLMMTDYQDEVLSEDEIYQVLDGFMEAQDV